MSEGEDLRLVPAALSAWGAMWLATSGDPRFVRWGAVVCAGAGFLALLRRSWTWASVALVVAACLGAGSLRVATVAQGPVSAAAQDRAVVTMVLRVDTDPRVSEGPFGSTVVVRATVTQIERGETLRVRAPVVVLAPGRVGDAWRELAVGVTVRVTGRLGAPDAGSDVAAIVTRPGQPQVTSPPVAWIRAVNHVRAGLSRASSALTGPVRGLVPALVLGDTSQVDPAMADDFRTTGLTHLTAVSGSNLTLLLGFVLVVARTAGLRGTWLRATSAAVAVAFVLLCRAEPSVVRAAAMGMVAIASLSSSARDRRGLRTLSVAVLVLMLVDPWLARSWGFALSVLACAGIIACASTWAKRMSWAPRWLAEAVAVPLAAQLFTQPAVTALSGQVSLVGLVANAIAGPLVGPATVLGLVVTIVALVSPSAAALTAHVAAVPAQGIVWVATTCARLPGSAVSWPASPVALGVLGVGCALGVGAAGWALGRRSVSLVLAACLVGLLSVTPRQPGWPPGSWVVAACDVGQGDATVFNAGAGSAVVIDTGPDPALLRTCLAGLAVVRVPLLVLTHDHADHVGGLGAALAAQPQLVLLSRTPSANRPRLLAEIARARSRSELGRAGLSVGVGNVRLDVIQAPERQGGTADADSTEENDAGLVLRVTSRGVVVLVTGDLGPDGQSLLLASGADVRCDVLKVPHHGSAHQNPDLLRATRARVALISVGKDNGYGHPARRTLDLLRGTGALVLRTDERGSVALSQDDQRLVAVVQRPE